MPVRSLHSSVLKWPDARTVDAAVRAWAAQLASAHPEVLKVGYWGSYARGDWGVGSDVDLVLILSRSDLPFDQRGRTLDATSLPVPADLLVYTLEEWLNLPEEGRFKKTLASEIVWVFERNP